MRWPSQRMRVLALRLIAPLIFIGVFLVGDRIWIIFAAIFVLMILGALETCRCCGGRLPMWGLPVKVADGTLVCSRCGGRWDLRGPL